jgi:hypothetical protein
MEANTQRVLLMAPEELIDRLTPVINEAVAKGLEQASKLRPVQRETLGFDEFIRVTGLSKNQCFKLERLGQLKIVRASPRILLVPKSELARWESGDMNT